MNDQLTTIGAGDRVVVTGASGFVGSAVARQLVDRGARVVVLLEPGADERNLAGLELERAVADVRDAERVAAALGGARFLFHLAAVYRFGRVEARHVYDVNVGGTRTVLAAARAAGCERVVYTSTVATLDHPRDRPADESSYPRLERLVGAYERSKYVAEHEALREAANGLPLVAVLPTTPVGPGDAAPTPTGRMVLDFLAGRMAGWVDTALNIVDVDDVAHGHLLAAERGTLGRSYILGGENLELREVFVRLGDATGLAPPRLQVPRTVLLPAALASSAIEGRLLRREPSVPVEGARIAATRRTFDDSRARDELGYGSRPAAEALERAARWYAANGYVSARRLGRIRWTSSDPGG